MLQITSCQEIIKIYSFLFCFPEILNLWWLEKPAVATLSLSYHFENVKCVRFSI